LRQSTLSPTEANDYDFVQMLEFDAIRPIYTPEFLLPAQIDLLEEDELLSGTLIEKDDLVMGVAWDGEAKAYPLWVLHVREMVNDELAGVPILVTW